jgi:two-component system, LytTR family, sensor kinase
MSLSFSNQMPQDRRSELALILGAWSAAGVLFAIHRYVGSVLRDDPISWAYDATKTFVMWQAWVLLTPLALWLSRRFPLDNRRTAAGVLAHCLGSVACVVVYSALDVMAVPLFQVAGKGFRWSYQAHDGWQAFQRSIAERAHWNVFIYVGIVSLDHAREFYRRSRERRLRAAQLEGQLSRAQLSALKAQLHPHFLFNTLNTVSAMLHRDPEAAGRMVGRLTELLRTCFEATNRHEVPLREELAFLQGYLEIQQMRFQDRLTVRMAVDPATLEANVASLILQPLVENAIRHGVGKNPQPGLVEIRVWREGRLLRLDVRDSGAGLQRGSTSVVNRGMGLTNVADRLTHLYGAASRLELASNEDGGVTARISLPFRLVGSPLAASSSQPASYELSPRQFDAHALSSSPGSS